MSTASIKGSDAQDQGICCCCCPFVACCCCCPDDNKAFILVVDDNGEFLMTKDVVEVLSNHAKQVVHAVLDQHGSGKSLQQDIKVRTTFTKPCAWPTEDNS